MDRRDLIPACPNCGRPDYLEVGLVFSAASGALVRELWQCSRAYEGWQGCGWQGARPVRVRLAALQSEAKVGAFVPEFTESQHSLQESGDVLLVKHPDGSKEIVF